jgi:hypothetical protein
VMILHMSILLLLLLLLLLFLTFTLVSIHTYIIYLQPHKEFLFLGAYAFKASVTLVGAGSGSLIGQSDIPLGRISSVPSEFQVCPDKKETLLLVMYS